MTGEELTFLMGKVLIVIRHFSSQLSASLPNSSMVRDSPLRVGSIPARAIQASAVSPGRTIDFRQVRSIFRRWEKAARTTLTYKDASTLTMGLSLFHIRRPWNQLWGRHEIVSRNGNCQLGLRIILQRQGKGP